MQAADAGKGDNVAAARRVYLAGFRSVLGQRQMSPAMGILGSAADGRGRLAVDFSRATC